jgi:hypothetical protein
MVEEDKKTKEMRRKKKRAKIKKEIQEGGGRW